MQTNLETQTLPEAPKNAEVRPARPSWAEVYGWYLAGGAVTVASWSVTGAILQGMHGRGSELVVTLLAMVEIAGLVAIGRGRPRRCRVALAIGAVTPVVLLALFLVWLVWAMSSWQF